MFTTSSKDPLKEDALNKGRQAAEELKNGARRMKNDLKEDFGETMDAVRDDLSEAARQAGKKMRQLTDEAEETLVTKIHDNPLQSILVAVAAGFFIGALFTRR